MKTERNEERTVKIILTFSLIVGILVVLGYLIFNNFSLINLQRAMFWGGVASIFLNLLIFRAITEKTGLTIQL